MSVREAAGASRRERAIVLVLGASRAVLGGEPAFLDSRRSVGRAEIDRLLGDGAAYGDGPLPRFLRAVAEARRDEGGPGLLVLRELAPPEAAEEAAAPALGVPDVLRASLEDAARIDAPPGRLPGPALAEALAPGGEAGPVLLVGCHTERDLLALALHLRYALGLSRVAVSPQLAGSASPDAHFAALRTSLPDAGVRVLLDMAEVADFLGLPPERLARAGGDALRIGPEEARAALTASQRRIVALLCMHWTRAELRPLAGGYSGSLLLHAQGWRGASRTEPSVLKVDGYAQMRRELFGYYRIKDLFGKHVPTFGSPVEVDDRIGVAMELAAIEGSPNTLQDGFEAADSEQDLERFLQRLEKALELLSRRLYNNSRARSWLVPYRVFGLHAEKQALWLEENARIALSYVEAGAQGGPLPEPLRLEPGALARRLRDVAANPDGLDCDQCLVHGDLNYANIICDEGENTWFIDWTHARRAPLEMDFAKLESDAKFVMSKDFGPEDLGQLCALEDYLLERRIPGDVRSLPARLQFAKWDLRYRKVLESVRRIRQACFAAKGSDDWLVYRIGLLRYATHTLSFDARRGRGECEPPQLLHALVSVDALLRHLSADGFHLKVRAERAPGYPPRQRVLRAEAPWEADCPSYDPPYHVAPQVLGAADGEAPGWAEPEDLDALPDPRVWGEDARLDDEGRPLNPHGRTGIAGRGLLGRWGPNLSLAALVVRATSVPGDLEILLGGREGSARLSVLKTFVLPGERPEAALARLLETEAGWRPSGDAARREPVFRGYVYDARQTDHAWVEALALLLRGDEAPDRFRPGGDLDSLEWWPLSAGVLNRLPEDQAGFLRRCVPRLVEEGRLPSAEGRALLEATG